MALVAEKIADLRLKHLEMIQAAVARMAAYSATLKNYCLTLVTAICGVSVTLQRPLIILLAYLPVVIFSILDAQYLGLERRFRCLFDLARSEDWNTMPSMEIDLSKTPRISLAVTYFSWSVASFYAALGMGVFAVLLITRLVYGRFV